MNTPPFSHLLKLHSFFLTVHCNWRSQEAGSDPCGIATGVQRVWCSHWQLWTWGCCSRCPLQASVHLLSNLTELYSTGTMPQGQLATWEWAEHLMKHTFFPSLSLPLLLSQPLFPNTNNPFISHLACQQNRYVGELGEWGNCLLQSVSHMTRATKPTCMQSHAF